MIDAADALFIFEIAFSCVVEDDDLLALELVGPAFAAGDVVDDAGGLAIGIEQQREHIGKYPAIGRIGAPMIDGDERHLVGGYAVDHRIGDANRQRVPGGSSGTALLALVAFDAALDFILGLALIPGELDAVDAAVADIDQIH